MRAGKNEADEDEREKNKGEIDVIACGEPPARALARSAGRWEHDSQARPAPALIQVSAVIQSAHKNSCGNDYERVDTSDPSSHTDSQRMRHRISRLIRTKWWRTGYLSGIFEYSSLEISVRLAEV